jgi:hypothetical protein
MNDIEKMIEEIKLSDNMNLDESLDNLKNLSKQVIEDFDYLITEKDKRIESLLNINNLLNDEKHYYKTHFLRELNEKTEEYITNKIFKILENIQNELFQIILQIPSFKKLIENQISIYLIIILAKLLFLIEFLLSYRLIRVIEILVYNLIILLNVYIYLNNYYNKQILCVFI